MMILLDPDLDPDPEPRFRATSPLDVWGRGLLPWAERLPTPRTLSRFLSEAQAAIRLRGRVSVLLTTDREIRRLNRQFRGIDKPTDVLSFPAESFIQEHEKLAGDLAISIPTARRQAEGQGHALTCELKILMLHGLLHLAGYDHETDTGQMARREQRLRVELGLPSGLIQRAGKARVSKTIRRAAGARP